MGGCGGGGERVPPTHMHMHVHAHMHAHMRMTSYGIPRDSSKIQGKQPFA